MVLSLRSCFILALASLSALHHLPGRLVALLEPRQRAPRSAQALDMAYDPTLPAHARVRGKHAGVDGPPLILSSEAHPEVGVLGPQGKAGEEPRPHEVAPASEHGRDLHLRPRAEDLVEGARGARTSAGEATARAPPPAQPANAARARYGQTCFRLQHGQLLLIGSVYGSQRSWNITGPPNPNALAPLRMPDPVISSPLTCNSAVNALRRSWRRNKSPLAQ